MVRFAINGILLSWSIFFLPLRDGPQAVDKASFPKRSARSMIHRKVMNDYLSNLNDSTRRKFFKQTGAALGLAGVAGLSKVSTSLGAEPWPVSSHAFVGKQEVILFQGDSITDAGRDRTKSALANDQAALGNGYAWLAAIELLLREGLGRPPQADEQRRRACPRTLRRCAT